MKSENEKTKLQTIEDESKNAVARENKDGDSENDVTDEKKSTDRTLSVSSTGSDASGIKSPVTNMLEHHRRMSSESSVGSTNSIGPSARRDSSNKVSEDDTKCNENAHDGKHSPVVISGHRKLSPSLSDVTISPSAQPAQTSLRVTGGPKSPEMGSLSSIKKSRSMSADSPLIVGETFSNRSCKTLTKPGHGSNLLPVTMGTKQVLSRSVSSTIDERTSHSPTMPSPLVSNTPTSLHSSPRLHTAASHPHHHQKHRSRRLSSSSNQGSHRVLRAPSGAGSKMVAERGIMEQSIPHGHKMSPTSSNSSGANSPELVFHPQSGQGELISRAVLASIPGKHRTYSGEMKRTSSFKRIFKSPSSSSLQVSVVYGFHLGRGWCQTVEAFQGCFK